MSGKDTNNVNVRIAGRIYPLKIKGEEESTILQIVDEVNEEINRFQSQYKNKDIQDCMSMVLLTYAYDIYKAKSESIDQPNLSDKILELDHLLDDLLK